METSPCLNNLCIFIRVCGSDRMVMVHASISLVKLNRCNNMLAAQSSEITSFSTIYVLLIYQCPCQVAHEPPKLAWLLTSALISSFLDSLAMLMETFFEKLMVWFFDLLTKSLCFVLRQRTEMPAYCTPELMLWWGREGWGIPLLQASEVCSFRVPNAMVAVKGKGPFCTGNGECKDIKVLVVYLFRLLANVWFASSSP